MILRLLWPIALSILWINAAFSIGVNPCGKINKKGTVRIVAEDISALSNLCDCSEMQALSFKSFRHRSLPACLAANDHLTAISFSKNPIQRLPEGIERLKQLQKLDISFTEIVYLPEHISELSSLKTLNLRGTQIVSLPDGLEHLEKIDMRMIDINRADQTAIREQYPSVKIYFSSPCQCE